MHACVCNQHRCSETLYSGITGEPLTADIFIGVVYYQRLRQMVSDKYQVTLLCDRSSCDARNYL